MFTSKTIRSIDNNNGCRNAGFFRPVVRAEHYYSPRKRNESEGNSIAQQFVSDTPGNEFFKRGALPIQRKLQLGSGDADVLCPHTSEVLGTSGKKMDQDAKNFLETRFGYGVENVQIHHDTKSNESSVRLSESAYAHSSHAVFNTGQHRPHIDISNQLPAHDLSHVVQQATASGFATGIILRQAGDENDNLYTDTHDTVGAVTGTIGNTLLEVGNMIGKAIHSGICAIGSQRTHPVTNPLWDISTFQSPGASGWFGAKFGCYRNNCGRRHHGWDIHSPVGATAMAVVSGNARHHNNPGGYGHYMDLRSDADPNLVYRYAHLSAWEPNNHYCPGDKIGETGVTGNADAARPHLHLQVIDNGNAVDPIGYFSEPSNVIEQSGTAKAMINKGDPEPCVPC